MFKNKICVVPEYGSGHEQRTKIKVKSSLNTVSLFIFFREAKMFVSRGFFVVQRFTSPFYVFVLHFPLMCIANCELRYFFRPLLKFMIFVKNPRKIPMTLFIIFSNSKIKRIISIFPFQFFFFFFWLYLHKF